jgi:hypothetical protein
VFYIYLRTNSDLCHLQYKLIGCYNRDEHCLLRGTEWVFKKSILLFVFQGLVVTFSAVLGGIFVNAVELDPTLIILRLQGKMSIFSLLLRCST